MTVKELIARLETMDQDMRIVVEREGEFRTCNADDITTGTLPDGRTQDDDSDASYDEDEYVMITSWS